jgi:hypothetical protein
MTGLSSPEDASALIEGLQAFDEDLTPREQVLLRSLLLSTLDPVERQRLVGQDFSDDQLEILRKLEGSV